MIRKKSLLYFLILLLTLCSLNMTVFAAETLSVSFSVDISVSGYAQSTSEMYSIELKPVDAANPMPQGSKSGVYKLLADGKGTFSFPTLEFERVGIYEYTIRQIPGKNPCGKYDKTVYDVCVTVMNSDDGGFDSYITVRNRKSGEKPDGILFDVYYGPVKDGPKSPQTADISNIELLIVFIGLSLFGILIIALRKKSDAPKNNMR